MEDDRQAANFACSRQPGCHLNLARGGNGGDAGLHDVSHGVGKKKLKIKRYVD